MTLRAAVAACALLAAAPALAQQASTADIDRMMAVIEAQQKQIDAMRAELNTLKSQRTASAAPTHAAPVAVAATTAPAAPSVDEDDRTGAQMVAEGFTWKDTSGRSLTLSGQINPAFNVVDDGISTDVFIVDNDTSGTRFRLDADAPLGQTTLGATLEIGASPNNSYDVSQLAPQTDADFNVRRAEVTFRDDRYGRLQLGKGSSAADDTAEYDLSLVAGPIMYAGVADIAGGILFTDGTDYSGTTVGDAFFDFDGDRLARIRYDTPMFGPLQGSASYGQDDQWAAAVTLGGDYGDWSGWTVGDFTVLAAASVYNTTDDTVDYAYAASGSVLHDPTGLSLTLSTGGYHLAEGDDPSNVYAKLGWDTEFWPLGPTGFGVDYTQGDNISSEGADGTSYGLAAVQRIDRYGIDLYAQIRRYELDQTSDPELNNVTVGTFGTKFTF
ncbi:porin [uncultured Amaricoccus sp.]|uniref:porin n=1 Tax=uncultured Amaricoccus sp. TaxID=339341 RepID=UPI0026359204|nr:porin [uncultured Amaricoccus sp.]